ncbi:MAG: dihydroorotate dehydrogenase-like protein [Candidatus Latescibacterota bacterium]|jgi:dihydroorotate dehydrogenase (fumarate)
MDLTTTYMGMKLRNPLVVSACPLSRDVAKVRQMEDAGAAAVVMFSLFEEEIRHEALELDHYLSYGTNSFSEALDYFPEHEEYAVGPEQYLEQIRKLKEAVDIPVIASLNGTTMGGWVEYGKKVEEAGADALELNVYHISTETGVSGLEIEQLHLDILGEVRKHVELPVAVKLSPYFSSMAHMARELALAGANALVLFNRFYQPDIDLDNLEVTPNVLLSTPQALRLPLRWIAILHGQVQADLAASSGIHGHEDVLKLLLAGANVTMMASALLAHGVGHLRGVLAGIEAWMAEHEYESVEQLQGSMSHRSYANPAAFERANYIKALNTFKA